MAVVEIGREKTQNAQKYFLMCDVLLTWDYQNFVLCLLRILAANSKRLTTIQQ
jgi:hypothetical protein